MYHVRHFVRIVLIAFEKTLGVEGVRIINSLGVDFLIMYTPDENHRMTELFSKRRLTLEAVRKWLGCSPLLLSCILCLLDTTNEQVLNRICENPFQNFVVDLRQWQSVLEKNNNVEEMDDGAMPIPSSLVNECAMEVLQGQQ